MSERPTSWGWTPPLSLAINAFSESGTVSVISVASGYSVSSDEPPY
jgi:hypothetical protein